jgi:hypothetical protein
MEEFSSFGPAGAKAQIASISGINHNSIGTQYDGYAGGLSAPVESVGDVALDYSVEVRSIIPDAEADRHGTDRLSSTQDTLEDND